MQCKPGPRGLLHGAASAPAWMAIGALLETLPHFVPRLQCCAEQLQEMSWLLGPEHAGHGATCSISRVFKKRQCTSR